MRKFLQEVLYVSKIETFQDLQKRMANFNLSNYQATICKNIKRIRKELYEENKSFCLKNNLRNPYSSQNVAELLGISHEYYKRLESFDKTKPISLKLFLKVVTLFDKDISEFFK